MLKELTDFIEHKYHRQIKAREILAPQPGATSGFPVGLHPRLEEVLRQQGIPALYTHQAEAFKSICANQDTLIVSRTASGKTLSFLLPILNEYIAAPSPFSVLLLYPTKALSRDQEGTLGKLMAQAVRQQNLGTFDGDTPQAERDKLQKSADFIITNPDMLHNGILPNHNRKWRGFLSRLRYIVVDEVHSYRGAFGSHVSNVFRRLLRVCDLHGSSPSFVCSSATVGNPDEHVEALFHRKFHVIRKDGSPRPGRALYFVNPAQAVSHGGALYRKGPASVSVTLIRQAARAGVRTICFCRARQEVERLYRAVCDRHPELKDVVKPYRGGLLPNERRKLEKGLFEGRIRVIISTNALELGINIGDLECCILSGFPGSVSSFWQQAGRVGRSQNTALIVYIARDVPVDQYIVNHPEFISAAPIERAWLNADNPYIILQHLPCASYEHPLRSREPGFDEPIYRECIEVLREQKVISPYKEMLRYALPDFPSRGVNLRGMTDYNIEIYCGSEVIGEIDPIGARGTLYKDAIYQHLGKRYMSLDLDLDQKLCRVAPVEVDYYTEAVWEKRLEMKDLIEEKSLGNSRLQFGYINVNKQPKLYKKIRERTFENIGYGPITLPPFEYDTAGFCLLPSREWISSMNCRDKRISGAAVYGLSYILRRVAPSLCMGDPGDIETDVSLAETGGEKWESALYLYDRIEGGAGYGEKIYELVEQALGLCLAIIRECGCASGCPSCVPPLPPGVEDEALAEFLIESNAAVASAKSLITSLLTGEIHQPDIRQECVETLQPLESPPVDVEALRLRKKLSGAGKLLEQKRKRVH